MSTKQELLEEKTVKDLTQMARDKDLSGYSQMKKAELVELIKSNYTKAEIEDWPKEEEEEEPEVEKEEEKEIEEQETREKIPDTETTEISKDELKKPKSVETVEVEGDFERVSRPKTKKETTNVQWPLIAVIIAVIIIVIALVAMAV